MGDHLNPCGVEFFHRAHVVLDTLLPVHPFQTILINTLQTELHGEVRKAPREFRKVSNVFVVDTVGSRGHTQPHNGIIHERGLKALPEHRHRRIRIGEGLIIHDELFSLVTASHKGAPLLDLIENSEFGILMRDPC